MNLNFKYAMTVLVALVFVHCGGSSGDIYGNCFSSRWENLPINIIINNEYEEEVVNLYNEVFGYEVFRIAETGIQFVITDLSVDPDKDELGKASEYCASGYITDAHLYVDSKILDENNFDLYELVVAHELGHAMGFDHMNTGIMTRYQDDYFEVSDQLANEQFVVAFVDRYPEVLPQN